MRVLYINAHGDLSTLKKDLENGPNHVFGNHRDCKNTYCDNVGESENSKIPILKETGLHYHIQSALDRLIVKGDQLIDNETNNRAELFMSILCRFNAGKRLNLTQRGSFATRAHLTGLRYNDGISWQGKTWKEIMKKSPGKHFKKFLLQKERAHNLECKRRLVYADSPQSNVITTKDAYTKEGKEKRGLDYCPAAEEIMLSEENLNAEKSRILHKLQVTEEEVNNIAVKTRGQWDNDFFKLIRKDRLTASFFGEVCRRRATTPCHALVKKILYGLGHISTEAMEYGKTKEKVAIELFKKSRPQARYQNSGIFLHSEYGFLGASPDGLIGENGLIEVKCLHKVHKSGKTLIEAVQTDNTLCVSYNKNNKIVLKRSHHYYYQIQGQLNIAKKDICFFVIYINDEQPLHVEAIKRDETFWKEQMLPKLQSFYYDCLLTEIVLRRIPKGLKALDPL